MIVRRKRQGGERCKSLSFLIEVNDSDAREAMSKIFKSRFTAPFDFIQIPNPNKDTMSEQEIIVLLTYVDTIPYLYDDVFATRFPYGFFGKQTAEQIARFIIRRAVAMGLIRQCESAPGQYYFMADKFKKRGRPRLEEQQ